ncbi:unnamed protein product [Gordionus sp. m RMFG-2023]
MRHNNLRKAVRRTPKTDNPYIVLLYKLYKCLATKTNSKFNRIILKRIIMSRTNRAPISLARIVRKSKGEENKLIVIVGKITDDKRLYKVPNLKICSLACTKTARQRILKAGGQLFTLDQLPLKAPTGKNTMLLQGPRKAREVYRHFGPAPGVPHSHTKPYVRSKGRKFEKARGKRKSRGYKA